MTHAHDWSLARPAVKVWRGNVDMGYRAIRHCRKCQAMLVIDPAGGDCIVADKSNGPWVIAYVLDKAAIAIAV